METTFQCSKFGLDVESVNNKPLKLIDENHVDKFNFKRLDGY